MSLRESYPNPEAFEQQLKATHELVQSAVFQNGEALTKSTVEMYGYKEVEGHLFPILEGSDSEPLFPLPEISGQELIENVPAAAAHFGMGLKHSVEIAFVSQYAEAGSEPDEIVPSRATFTILNNSSPNVETYDLFEITDGGPLSDAVPSGLHASNSSLKLEAEADQRVEEPEKTAERERTFTILKDVQLDLGDLDSTPGLAPKQDELTDADYGKMQENVDRSNLPFEALDLQALHEIAEYAKKRGEEATDLPPGQ